jgi:hypothetical protein
LLLPNPEPNMNRNFAIAVSFAIRYAYFSCFFRCKLAGERPLYE